MIMVMVKTMIMKILKAIAIVTVIIVMIIFFTFSLQVLRLSVSFKEFSGPFQIVGAIHETDFCS